MKKLKYQVGDTVYHDYSGDEGKVIKVRNWPSGYVYFVDFGRVQDWFKEQVLLSVPPATKEAE